MFNHDDRDLDKYAEVSEEFWIREILDSSVAPSLADRGETTVLDHAINDVLATESGEERDRILRTLAVAMRLGNPGREA